MDTSAENRVPRFKKTFEDSVVYADGWARLPHATKLIEAFWLDGFDPPTAAEKAAGQQGQGPENPVSPIFGYQSGDFGAFQWINVAHDRAAVLIASKTALFSGFHLWISPGVGRKPYEVASPYPSIVIGDSQASRDAAAAAATFQTEQRLGLRRL